MDNKIKVTITITIAILLALLTALYFTNKNNSKNFDKQNIKDIEETVVETVEKVQLPANGQIEENEVAVPDTDSHASKIIPQKQITQPKKIQNQNRQITNTIPGGKSDVITVKDIQDEIKMEIPKDERVDIVEVNNIYKPGLKENVKYRGVNYVIKIK